MALDPGAAAQTLLARERERVRARGERLDIAVEGMPPTHEAKAWSTVETIVKLPVDLVRIEDAPPDLRRRIQETGEVLVG